MTLWGEEWEYEWSYFLTPGALKMQERMQAKIKKALGYLREMKEEDAAKSFAAMLADDLTRLEITNAVTRFHLERTDGGEKVRQGDVLDLSNRLEAVLDEVKDVQSLLARRRVSLDGIPGLPDGSEIARRGDDALEAVYDLVRLANDLHRAVIAEHGEDTGGPTALSQRLAGDPLDRLADALAVPWQRHGGGLTGAPLNDFMRVLRAVNEAETEEQDIPERAEKRIRKNLRSGTQPP